MSTPLPQFHTHSCDSDSDLDSDSELNPMNSLLSPQSNPTTATATAAGDPNIRRHHVTSINTDVIIRQLPSEGLSFQLWPAATTLFTLLDTRHPSILSLCRPTRPIRILELGSGTGLVGITAAATLGAHVTVTDLPHVIPNLEFNVAANAGVIAAGGGAVVAAELSWGDLDQMEGVGREYDVIMGSDVVYHDHLYEPLLETLKYFLVTNEEKQVVFLMAHLKRWKKEKVFFRRARKLFDVHVIHRDCPDHGKRLGVIVYRFVAKPNQRKSTSRDDHLSKKSS